MPKQKIPNSINLYSFHILLLVVGLIAFAGTYAVSSNMMYKENSDVLSNSSQKTEKAKGNTDKKVPAGSVKQAPGKPIYNNDPVLLNETGLTANSHKEKVRKVISALEEVASEEGILGNSEASAELSQVVEAIDGDEAEETAEAIEEVEGQPAWKTFLVGTDYKNLGQLRSSIVKNRNTIRKLTKTMAKVESPEGTVAIQAQIAALETEQSQIANLIRTNESKFSLLGWVFKFMSGYTNTPAIGGLDADLPEDDESTESTESTDTGAGTE